MKLISKRGGGMRKESSYNLEEKKFDHLLLCVIPLKIPLME